MLTGILHTWSAEAGYTSEFSSVPPDLKKDQPGSGATFGVVTDINDPENLGRVRAQLTAFEDQQTDWMNIVMPAAGAGKGAIMLPDVGDQVLILFLNGDPGRGIVIGGIFGASRQPPDWGMESGRVMRFSFLTPAGQKLTLDDAAQSLKMENQDGSFLELHPGTVTLHSKTDIDIAAPGRRITITGNRIDFQRG